MTVFNTGVRKRIASAAQHAMVFFFALVSMSVGLGIFWYNKTSLTLTILIAGSSFVVLAMLLAIPTNFKQVVVFVTPYIDARLGGKRKTDPQPADIEVKIEGK